MKKIIAKISALGICAMMLCSCGTEIGRIPVNTVSVSETETGKSTSIDLKKGDQIAVWSEMDMEYTDEVNLQFKVKVLFEGNEKGELNFDPRSKNVSINEVKTEIMDRTTWSFSGKNTGFKAENDGKYTFNAILLASENPSLKIHKAEVVFKK